MQLFWSGINVNWLQASTLIDQFGACRKMEYTENALSIKVDEHIITNEQVLADHFYWVLCKCSV